MLKNGNGVLYEAVLVLRKKHPTSMHPEHWSCHCHGSLRWTDLGGAYRQWRNRYPVRQSHCGNVMVASSASDAVPNCATPNGNYSVINSGVYFWHNSFSGWATQIEANSQMRPVRHHVQLKVGNCQHCLQTLLNPYGCRKHYRRHHREYHQKCSRNRTGYCQDRWFHSAL